MISWFVGCFFFLLLKRNQRDGASRPRSTAKTSTADGRPKPNFAEREPKPKSPEKQKSQEDWMLLDSSDNLSLPLAMKS